MKKERKKEIRWCSSPTILDWIGIWKRGKTHHYKTENQQHTQLNSGVISSRILTCESSKPHPSPPKDQIKQFIAMILSQITKNTLDDIYWG